MTIKWINERTMKNLNSWDVHFEPAMSDLLNSIRHHLGTTEHLKNCRIGHHSDATSNKNICVNEQCKSTSPILATIQATLTHNTTTSSLTKHSKNKKQLKMWFLHILGLIWIDCLDYYIPIDRIQSNVSILRFMFAHKSFAAAVTSALIRNQIQVAAHVVNAIHVNHVNHLNQVDLVKEIIIAMVSFFEWMSLLFFFSFDHSYIIHTGVSTNYSIHTTSYEYSSEISDNFVFISAFILSLIITMKFQSCPMLSPVWRIPLILFAFKARTQQNSSSHWFLKIFHCLPRTTTIIISLKIQVSVYPKVLVILNDVYMLLGLIRKEDYCMKRW